MLPRSLKIRVGDAVTYEGRVFVVRRIFLDGTFILRGVSPLCNDGHTLTVRYIDSEVKLNRITFLQI